jgi:TolA-binding protein
MIANSLFFIKGFFSFDLRAQRVVNFLIAGYLCFFAACSPDSGKEATGSPEKRKELIAAIDSLQKGMVNQQSLQVDKNTANNGIAAYSDFVKLFPEDSLSPEYLFRLSDLSRATGDTRNAIDNLARICKSYPAFRKIPECLFLQGYYYQEYFNDTMHAKDFYLKLIANYPQHAFADDAKALLKTFGKSDEEIIKGFEKNAADKK